MDQTRTGRTVVPGAIITGRTMGPGEPGLDKMLEVVGSSPDPVAAQAFLVVLSGGEPGRLHQLQRPEMVIGRSKYADIRINERAMSQQHAKLVRWGDHHRIYDLGSTNGTFVNNQRITEAELFPGDTVRTGETVFSYMAGSQPTSSEHTMAIGTARSRPPSTGGGALAPIPYPPQQAPGATSTHLARRNPNTGLVAAPPPGARVFEVPMPRVGPEPEQDLLGQLLKIIAFFSRYWLSILICAFLGAAGGFAFYKLKKPAAKAEFELSLVPKATDNPLEAGRRMNFEFFRSAQQNFVRPLLILETLQELGEEDVPEDRVRAIQKRLEFQRTGEFSYSGAFDAATAEEAIAFLEVHLRLYLKQEVDKTLKALVLEVETLEQRLRETEESITATEQAVLSFRKEHTKGLPEQAQELASNLIALGTERGRAASEVARTSAELRLSKQRLKSESPIIESRLEMARPYENTIADVKRQLAEAKAAGKGNQHPEVVALKSQLKQLEDLRDDVMQNGTGTDIVRAKNPLYKDARLQADAAEAAHAIAVAELNRLTNDIERSQEIAEQMPELQAEYAELVRSYEASKKVHDALFEKLSASRTQLDMERASVTGRFDVIVPPNVKLTPWIRTLAIRVGAGLIAGFIFGIFLGMLRDLRRLVAARLAART